METEYRQWTEEEMRFSRFIAVLSATIILLTPYALGDEKAEQDAVKMFKQHVSSLISKYNAEKHVRVEYSPLCGTTNPHGYLKASYEADLHYKLDVRRTDSLITPYVGILGLRWNERYSECRKTGEEAQTQSDFPHSDFLDYRYTYGYQDGKWIPQDREVGGLTDHGVEWEQCADEKAKLEAMGYEADYGCLVPF